MLADLDFSPEMEYCQPAMETGPWNVIVRLLSGNIVANLQLDGSSTVRELKQRNEEALGGSGSLQKLLLGERLLRNSELIGTLPDPAELTLVLATVDIEMCMLLSAAAATGDMVVVSSALEQCADIDYVDEEGRTPLLQATKFGHTEVVRALCNSNCDVDQVAARTGRSALQAASLAGNAAIVEVLCSEGHADVDLAGSSHSPAYIAAQEGCSDVLRLLVKHRADLEKTGNNGNSPVHIAARQGHLDTLQLLMESSANIEKAMLNGNTPLHIASKQGHVGITQFLLKNRASTDALIDGSITPLHVAAKAGHLKVLEALCVAKAAKCDADFDEVLAGSAKLAAKQGHAAVVNFLFEEIQANRWEASISATTGSSKCRGKSESKRKKVRPSTAHYRETLEEPRLQMRPLQQQQQAPFQHIPANGNSSCPAVEQFFLDGRPPMQEPSDSSSSSSSAAAAATIPSATKAGPPGRVLNNAAERSEAWSWPATGDIAGRQTCPPLNRSSSNNSIYKNRTNTSIGAGAGATDVFQLCEAVVGEVEKQEPGSSNHGGAAVSDLQGLEDLPLPAEACRLPSDGSGSGSGSGPGSGQEDLGQDLGCCDGHGDQNRHRALQAAARKPCRSSPGHCAGPAYQLVLQERRRMASDLGLRHRRLALAITEARSRQSEADAKAQLHKGRSKGRPSKDQPQDQFQDEPQNHLEHQDRTRPQSGATQSQPQPQPQPQPQHPQPQAQAQPMQPKAARPASAQQSRLQRHQQQQALRQNAQAYQSAQAQRQTRSRAHHQLGQAGHPVCHPVRRAQSKEAPDRPSSGFRAPAAAASSASSASGPRPQIDAGLGEVDWQGWQCHPIKSR